MKWYKRVGIENQLNELSGVYFRLLDLLLGFGFFAFSVRRTSWRCVEPVGRDRWNCHRNPLLSYSKKLSVACQLVKAVLTVNPMFCVVPPIVTSRPRPECGEDIEEMTRMR